MLRIQLAASVLCCFAIGCDGSKEAEKAAILQKQFDATDANHRAVNKAGDDLKTKSDASGIVVAPPSSFSPVPTTTQQFCGR